MLGNEFTESTYRYAGKPIFRLPVPTPNVYPTRYDKDFSHSRNRFLWLGSGGLVHKGLDLVLEAFSELPDQHLTVCGPVDDPEERAFKKAYHRELYETANIHTVGWVDVSSQQFVEITDSCAALIYPSCSEGQAGSVVTCLQAGVIPVISYQAGVNVGDFGLLLSECSRDEIKNTIKRLSSMPNQELQDMSRKAREYARAKHTREAYLNEFTRIIETIEQDIR